MGPVWNLAILVAVVAVLLLLFRPGRGLVGTYRRHRRLNDRILREDALKFLAERELTSKPASVAAIAGSLGVDADRASVVIGEMLEAGQADRSEQGIEITPRGRETALHLIRAHRLWELFLAEKTGFGRDEWHARADEKEHRLDRLAVRELASQLGNPVVDPDGDPIPGLVEGTHLDHDGIALADLAEGDAAVIVHLEDEPASIYGELVAQDLYPGLIVRVTESNRHRVRFWAGHRECALSPLSAANISVVSTVAQPEVQHDGVVTLAELEPGRTAEVVEIDPSCRGAERNRFLDLGIVPGAAIQTEFRSAGGDPTAYRIQEALIALRVQQTEKIFVREVSE